MLPLALYLFAQPPRALHAGELARAIDRLGVAGNVLYVAAHPDDENTRLLAWLVGAKGVRAAYLSMTRGDGGQNLIGSEQGPLLGLIRTQELLAARRIDGAEQFFTRARDFGYSKTPEETLALWNRDEMLADMVTIIRRFKPDLIVTRFNAHDRDTHGHHTSSAILAEAAFHAAADPKYHPGQGTWQAKRLVWNSYSWDPKAPHPGEIKIDTGIYDPLLGESFGELAARSRSMHKSQGFGASATRGHANEWFVVAAGAPASQSIFEGIDLTWARVQGADKFAGLIKRARAEFRPDKPEASIPVLLEAMDALAAMPANPWKEPKREELAHVIAGCAGLWLEATAADYGVVPGGKLGATAIAINRSDAKVALEEVRLPGETVKVGKAMPREEPISVEHAVSVPANATISNPYWLAEKPEPGLYTVKDPAMIGLPENPPAIAVEFVVSVNGHRLTLSRPLQYKWTDPVAGERYRPVEIVPQVTVNPARSLLVFPDGRAKSLRVTVKAGAANVSGALKPELPAGWRAEPASQDYQLAARGDEKELNFTIHPGTASGGLRFGARSMTLIEHGHIPIQTLFPEAEVKLVRVDLKKTHTHIGYIAGAGDEVADALRQVGYDVTPLGDDALASEPLSKFDAIVTGVRAWNVDKRLPFLHARLMDYVKNGGTLVVQYNTNNRIGKAPPDLGPHPFEISQERVTDERAAVTMADHPILRAPNRITAADFEGWIQERGLYFAGKWDAKYDAPLAMNDTGEPARKGGLLVTKFGKGAFVYTGLAFFRQLPGGVPGAYRLFANLIAYGR